MGDLRGKVAVVTGASKGIGAAIAKRLSAAGAAVVVNYSSSKEDGDRVVADINAKGARAIAVKGDIAKAEHVRQLFDETKKAFGILDVLVNNAGVRHKRSGQAFRAEWRQRYQHKFNCKRGSAGGPRSIPGAKVL
jgi:3-oxoacyl-[acyl-carrier protein] reductase